MQLCFSVCILYALAWSNKKCSCVLFFPACRCNALNWACNIRRPVMTITTYTGHQWGLCVSQLCCYSIHSRWSRCSYPGASCWQVRCSAPPTWSWPQPQHLMTRRLRERANLHWELVNKWQHWDCLYTHQRHCRSSPGCHPQSQSSPGLSDHLSTWPGWSWEPLKWRIRVFVIKLILDPDLEPWPGAGFLHLGQEQQHCTHTSLKREERENSNLASYQCRHQTCVLLCDIPQ